MTMPESMLVMCRACNASGWALGEDKWITCKICDGERILDEVTCDVCDGFGCDYCRGEGVLRNVECPDCQAEGEIRVPTKCHVCSGYGDHPPKEMFE